MLPEFIDPVYLLALPVFSLTMLLEAWLLGGRSDLRGYTLSDTFGSLGMGTGYLVLNAAWKLVVLSLFVWLYQFRVFELEATVGTFVLLVLAEDLCMYWTHRLSHEIRVFWCAHHNHHSSEHYNLSTALRQSWTEQLFKPVLYMALPLLGFPVELIILQMALNLMYQYWVHTELIGTLGWFGWVFNTPSHHRVHHGRNVAYLDKNYGGIFILWDRLFGTFQAETEPVDYGVKSPVGSDNPFRIAFSEYANLWRDVRGAETWRGVFGYLFAPPGWREDGNHQTASALQGQQEAPAK